MSIEINCKDIKVEDIMRDVKEKSESVIYGGWHVVIGTPNKHNEPIIKFINLDSLTEDEQHELLRNLDVMKTQLQLNMNSAYGIINPLVGTNMFTVRKFNIINSLWKQVLRDIQSKKNDNEEETENKTVIIDCKDKYMVDILKNILNVLYGEVSNSSPDVEFKNLDSLWIDELKELNKKLDGLYNTIKNTIIPLSMVEKTQYVTWRLHRILDLQRQVIKEAQRKENESRKLEDVYSKMPNDELKNELEALNEWKNHYETNLNEYEPNVRVHPTWVKNFEEALQDTKSKIDMINKILAYRELKESSMRGKKFNRYNNLEVEELEMILDALNVKCTLRKCELHKCEDNCESREIKKAMDEIIENIKIIKDVLKYKRGE